MKLSPYTYPVITGSYQLPVRTISRGDGSFTGQDVPIRTTTFVTNLERSVASSLEIGSPETLALTEEGRHGITAIVPRSSDPDEDLVIYEEKADRRTIDWIIGLKKKIK